MKSFNHSTFNHSPPKLFSLSKMFLSWEDFRRPLFYAMFRAVFTLGCSVFILREQSSHSRPQSVAAPGHVSVCVC